MYISQVMASIDSYQPLEEFDPDMADLKKGDNIFCIGYPERTKKGILSVIPKKVH